MKKYIHIYCSFLMLLIASCSQHKDISDDGSYTPPMPGTIVAADSMKVTDEPLNHFMFSVTVKTNDNTKYGVYDVRAKCGPDVADGQFSMPHGGEHQKPLIRKGSTPNTYIIGFRYGTDTAFYDYYEVKNELNGTLRNISMKYLKAYSFK